MNDPEMPVTPRTRKVLALAHREAKALGHAYVGTEHVLLGLLKDGEGTAFRCLKECTDVARLRTSIIEAIGSKTNPPPPEHAGPPVEEKAPLGTARYAYTFEEGVQRAINHMRYQQPGPFSATQQQVDQYYLVLGHLVAYARQLFPAP